MSNRIYSNVNAPRLAALIMGECTMALRGNAIETPESRNIAISLAKKMTKSFVNDFSDTLDKLFHEVDKEELDLARSVIDVGSILADDRPDNLSVIYGHPTQEQWVSIFLKARSIMLRTEGSKYHEST